MEIIWEIVRHALGLAISIPILLIGILWLWTSLDGFGKLQVAVIPLFLSVGFAQGLFGFWGSMTVIAAFTAVFVWIVRRI